ncbi:MAG: acylneuraminate cytidylyltransferase family protein [Candidatus Omnitrophota bacterium]
MNKKSQEIIAVIPARGGSKGIRGKNIMDFCGKPLIAWSILQAKNSKYIKDVYVSSDSKEIINISEVFGAKSIKRPKSLSGGKSSSEQALLHAIENIEKQKRKKIDICVFLQATSPLREECDIGKAVNYFINKKADSLFSSSLLDDFCAWEIKNKKLKGATFDYKNRGRRQERKPYYLENGSIYIFKPGILRKNNNRFGGKIEMYLMPLWKSFEIDKAEDVEICEFFMKRRILNKY